MYKGCCTATLALLLCAGLPLVQAKEKPSAVHQAAAKGDVGTLAKLLKKQPALANARNAEGMTPLHMAAMNGRAGAVGFLITNGAEINAVATKDNTTPLVLAVLGTKMAAVDTLLAHGADPNVLTPHGGAALHMAAGSGNLPLVERLLARGAEVNQPDRNEGWSPLFHAIFYKRDSIAWLLIGRNAELGIRAHRGYTVLHVAAANGDVRAVKLLIDNGADVNAADTRKRTPLHEAAHKGYTEVVKLLLSKGADQTVRDEFDSTPLTEAQQQGHSEIVELFIRGQGSKH